MTDAELDLEVCYLQSLRAAKELGDSMVRKLFDGERIDMADANEKLCVLREDVIKRVEAVIEESSEGRALYILGNAERI